MSPTREDVVAAVRRTFPAERAAEILALLDSYGADSSEEGRARVQLAILALSQGDDGKLLHYVDAALVDFRDVLSWAEDDGQSPHERAVLEVLGEAWSWAIPQPLRIEAVSHFGNVVVACADGALWRVCPEGLAAQSLGSERDLVEWLDDDEFREDWLCLAWVDAARAALGVPGEGQCYGFGRWPVLGGVYAVENFAIKTVTEWLAVSGDVGRQMKALPDGAKVRLDVSEG